MYLYFLIFRLGEIVLFIDNSCSISSLLNRSKGRNKKQILKTRKRFLKNELMNSVICSFDTKKTLLKTLLNSIIHKNGTPIY